MVKGITNRRIRSFTEKMAVSSFLRLFMKVNVHYALLKVRMQI